MASSTRSLRSFTSTSVATPTRIDRDAAASLASSFLELLAIVVLIWVAVGGRNVLLAAFLGALLVRSVEGELSDRLGDYWLLALGMLFVVTVVLMPTGLFGRVLMPQLPKRLRGES